jgi:hypothetical protein
MTHSYGLTNADRCDRDQAERASVVLVKDSHYKGRLELQLCHHHHDDNADRFELEGWTVAYDADATVSA